MCEVKFIFILKVFILMLSNEECESKLEDIWPVRPAHPEELVELQC
jgi:hypothetical protein